MGQGRSPPVIRSNLLKYFLFLYFNRILIEEYISLFCKKKKINLSTNYFLYLGQASSAQLIFDNFCCTKLGERKPSSSQEPSRRDKILGPELGLYKHMTKYLTE